mmetsp:Transcript_49501/g.153093  ORF Transcript_49501/g.153093 Transcript_49501/m.153093 type:complete len:232 (-) Transcript_49501:93-788(-)
MRVKVWLDGAELRPEPVPAQGTDLPPGAMPDRRFFACWGNAGGLSPGAHCLAFEAAGAGPGAEGPRLAFVQLLELGGAKEYRAELGYVGAFPTWDIQGKERYRPTDVCLMRHMHSGKLCPICKEAIWLNMLTRVSLIDRVEVAKEAGVARVSLRAPALAQLRPEPVYGLEEALEVSWDQAGRRRGELQGRLSFELPEKEAAGRWAVRVSYKTSEVRLDSKGLLAAKRAFKV